MKNRAKNNLNQVPIFPENFNTLQSFFNYYKQVMVSSMKQYKSTNINKLKIIVFLSLSANEDQQKGITVIFFKYITTIYN